MSLPILLHIPGDWKNEGLESGGRGRGERGWDEGGIQRGNGRYREVSGG